MGRIFHLWSKNVRNFDIAHSTHRGCAGLGLAWRGFGHGSARFERHGTVPMTQRYRHLQMDGQRQVLQSDSLSDGRVRPWKVV